MIQQKGLRSAEQHERMPLVQTARAAINGFDLLQSEWPEVYKLLQLINHYVIRGPV